MHLLPPSKWCCNVIVRSRDLQQVARVPMSMQRHCLRLCALTAHVTARLWSKQNTWHEIAISIITYSDTHSLKIQVKLYETSNFCSFYPQLLIYLSHEKSLQTTQTWEPFFFCSVKKTMTPFLVKITNLNFLAQILTFLAHLDLEF